ncbi:hypothetical protein ACFWCA_19175 [Streptomyces phaeochromogenes]|uniref:hypothetical protein n=1 Tax=Streptomyces phaeochromogenes TaxID=1923 RepID=UPI0036AC0CA1
MHVDLLVPVSVLDDALSKAYAAARATLTLVSVTLHHQFPEGAYLVLTRPVDYDYQDTVRLHSIRDARGETLLDLSEHDDSAPLRLPAVPEHLATLWGNDPSNSGVLLELLQRIDALAPYEYLPFLPAELWTADEVEAESSGEARIPLGIRLAAEHCPVHGVFCEPDDHVEPSTVHGEVI